MIDGDWARELLFADVALEQRVASAADVARAVERCREAGDSVADALEANGSLSSEDRAKITELVAALVADAEDNAEVALARRGGIDQSIHSSLAPETSAALLREGAGARAPLRVVGPERYKDFTLVGRGGMGVVYLALDTELNRRVAFKMVRPDPNAPKDTPAPETPLRATPPSMDIADDDKRSFEELKIRFLQEAWVTGAMEHPGVVPVYELGKTEAGIPYYTMRYVRGERTLGTAIKEAKDLDDRLALLEPFLKVCDAVRYAHSRGVMHRDIKPENVALGEFGEAIVIDWGLSKMTGRPDVSGSMWRARIEEFRDATDLQTVAGALGTPGYMAPEAALGKSDEVDQQSDIYSLGALLFEILTGRLPTQFKTFMEYVQNILEGAPPPAHDVAPGVPVELSEVCARALARQKADRFESVDEMAQAVRRWQTEGRLKLQIEELVETAREEFEAALHLSGNMMLWHLDRATAACTRVLHLQTDHGDAIALAAEVKHMREQGIRQRVSAGRRKLIAVAGFFVLAVASIVTLIIANRFSEQRREAETQAQALRQQLATKAGEVRAAESDRRDAIRRRADLYAGLSVQLLHTGDVAGARLVAARAVEEARTPAAWRALATVSAYWTPTLVTVLRGVANGPVALGRRRLYVSTADGVKEFLFATGEFGKTFAAKDVVLLAISPDGTRLATFEKSGTSLVWDTLRGKLAGELDTNRVLPTVAAFSHDNRFVYIGRENGSVVMLDLKKHEDAEYITNSGPAVSAMSVGRNGKRLYTGRSDGKIDRWHLPSLVRVVDSLTPAKARILHVSASRSGESVYACTANHLVIATEINSGDDFTMYRGPEHELAFAVPTRNYGKLYTASKQGAIAVWNLEQHRLQARVRNLNAAIDSFAISRDGSRLAVASGGDVYVWALDEAWRSGAREPITALAQAASGKRLWLARPDHSIELWDSENGRSLARWPAHTATITALAVDGDRLLSASLDGTIAVWPLGGGKATVRFDGPGAPTAIAVDAQGTIHTGNISGEIEVWSLRRERFISRLVDPGPLPIVAIRIEGQHLQSWDTAGTWRGWNLSTRNPEPGEGTPRPAATISGKSPAILGEAVDWIRKSERRRLIDLENRYGFMIEGATVVPVPADLYQPKRPRVIPWSKMDPR